MNSRNRISFSLLGATILLAFLQVMATQSQPALAQYPSGSDTGSSSVSEKTLQKCSEMAIPRAECSDQTVLLKERLGSSGAGSGTPMLATGSEQLFIFVGILGSVFGGVAAAFLIQSKRSASSIKKANS